MLMQTTQKGSGRSHIEGLPRGRHTKNERVPRHERPISLKGRSLCALPFFTSPCFEGLAKTQRRQHTTFCSRDYLAAFVAPCAARLNPPAFLHGLSLVRPGQVSSARNRPNLNDRTCPRLTKAPKISSSSVTTRLLYNRRRT